METLNEQVRKLPVELLTSLNEARAAIAQQRYSDALVMLQEGLSRKYDPATLDGSSLLEQFLGLVWILEFNLQQTKGIDWEGQVVKVPEKDTQCSFCKNYAETASLISGAEAIICDDCVGICNDILAEAKE